MYINFKESLNTTDFLINLINRNIKPFLHHLFLSLIVHTVKYYDSINDQPVLKQFQILRKTQS